MVLYMQNIGNAMRGAFIRRIAYLTVVTGCGALGWPAAGASTVEASGTLDTNLGPPLQSISTDYQHPVFLDVAKIVQLTGSVLNGSDHVAMGYFGQVQFGRLSAHAHIGGNSISTPNLSTSVSISVSFQDVITPQNLNPLAPTFLRLDVDLSGLLIKVAPDSATHIGGTAGVRFGVGMLSLDSNSLKNVSGVSFARFGDQFLISDGAGSTLGTHGFVPYPGGEPAFTKDPAFGAPGYFFGAKGYVDVPLFGGDADVGPPFAFGEPFLLQVSAGASASCHAVQCAVDANFFDTALIGNARIVDNNGAIVQGAAFSSASGYDYITPPSALAIPEPETYAMLLAGLGLLGCMARRRSSKLRGCKGSSSR